MATGKHERNSTLLMSSHEKAIHVPYDEFQLDIIYS
jgi:hypothetical protein